jgi:rubredoxin
VIPKTLRDRALDLAHEGHQGIVKTKERLRTKVWWVGMDKDSEKRVRSCHECQLVSQPAQPEPMIRTSFPNAPWEDLAVDLLGPLPSGESILVVVDYYSRYFETVILKSTTSSRVIEALENVFTTHGLPLSLKSDNGPQFISTEFREFVTTHGIEHRHTTPLWPQANGEVERQNRTLMKAIRIAHSEGKDWRRELNTFLLAYRSTPHQTTGVSPAELLFKRKIRTKMPDIDSIIKTELDESIRDRDKIRKEQGKQYADEKRRAEETKIGVGDDVLLQQKKTGQIDNHF